jgi:hypothetical protein
MVYGTGEFMKLRVFVVVIGALCSAATAYGGPGNSKPSAQSAQTSEKSADPGSTYDASAVTVTYVQTESGGVQRVTANESGDAKQIGLIRSSLQRLADNFTEQDFPTAAPNGRTDTSALATLLSAPPGAVRTRFVEIRGGAEVRYSSDNPQLVSAVHRWFEAVQSASAGAHASGPSVMAPSAAPQVR